jgi:hypothetical protein
MYLCHKDCGDSRTAMRQRPEKSLDAKRQKIVAKCIPVAQGIATGPNRSAIFALVVRTFRSWSGERKSPASVSFGALYIVF